MAQKEVSHKKAAVLGLQHLLAMYSGAVAVPLLIGTALKFNSEQMTYLVSIDIFMCGLATMIQLFRNKYFGIGLPVVLGCAIQAVAPLEMIGQKFSINTMYGAIIVAGIFVFLVAGWFSKIKKLFPPVVTGTLITVIGLTLVPVAVQNMGGGNAQAKDFGDAKNLIAAFLTILIIVAIESLDQRIPSFNFCFDRINRRNRYCKFHGTCFLKTSYTSFMVPPATAFLLRSA